jgi:translocation and assembly module TamA
MAVARTDLASSRPRTGSSLAPLALVAAVVSGCPAHIIPNAAIVREVNFRGVRQVDEEALRNRLALRETPMFFSTHPRWLRWWRWWWEDPEYFDETALVRDRLRVLRYLQARGFYDARVEAPTITSNGAERVVDFNLTEGEPTLIADVRLRGCEGDRARVLPEGGCRAVREHLDQRIGSRFDESTFAHDRDQVVDFTRDAGFATPTVLSRAIVDPAQHLAWVEYTIRPGPPSRFGRVQLLMTPSRDPVTGDELPNGLPVRPVISAINIEPGSPYNRVLLARAQQALFDLGVFGIARLEEVPRGDGVVDVNAILSPTRLWRLRVGFGAHADTTITNVHALVSFTHRNFFGGMRRLRIDVVPKLFFSSLLSPSWIFDPNASFDFTPGVSAAAEIQQPEMAPHATGVASISYELGPDPLNPQVGYRQAIRGGVGLEAHISRQVTGSFFIRTTNVTYLPYPSILRGGRSVSDLDADPLLRQQFFNRGYVHFEQAFTWDRRDNPSAPRRGTVLTLNLAEGTRSPLSDYSFLRMQTEMRGYVPLGRNFTFAARGLFGAVVGSSYYDREQGRWYWPVPPELRFFSGGPQSNRGYAPNRVGLVGAPTLRDLGPSNPAIEDPNRYVAIGGTAIWEGSVELRWQPSKFGLVAFLDASNVTGIAPDPFLSPVGVNSGCRATATNRVIEQGACNPPNSSPIRSPETAAPPPEPQRDAVSSLLDFSGWDAFVQSAHPTVGIGLRYATPVGPLRVDFGLRLADLGCDRTAANVVAQNRAVSTGSPAYYVLGTPRCGFLFWDNLPLSVNLSIGEAY